MDSIGTLMIDQIADQIKEQIELGLPGECAQLKMAPSVRNHSKPKANPQEAIQSSVLILLFPNHDGLSTVLMERTDLGPHGGQISLPGGKREPEDLSSSHTALRETWEEIGVPPQEVQLIGSLSRLYVPHSNFCIQPFLGYLAYSPELKPDPREVKSLISVRIHDLFDPKNKKQEIIRTNQRSITAPFYAIGRYKIWGATAMILSELESIISGIFE